mmetsp:Transcript_20203/g.47122  ORF Transcript_20203/g.47122 Transcript_20203/m.47122 type:complete len:820 (-) Transcript_20203:219-2678(-)
MTLFGCGICYPDTKDEVSAEKEEANTSSAYTPAIVQEGTPAAPAPGTVPGAPGYRSQRSTGSALSQPGYLSHGASGLVSEFLKRFPKNSPCAGPDELRWINYMLNVMWPHMREVMIAKGRNEMLERAWMEMQRHKELKVQELDVEFDPGSKPPQLKGLHAYKKEQEEFTSLEVDVDVEWNPKDEFTLKPKLKGNIKGVPIDTGAVFVSGLEFSSVVSCQMSPFVDQEPCIGCMQIFFYDPPGVTMYMSGLKQMSSGIGVILKGIMEKIILRVMEEAFVLPHRLLVPVRHDLPLETLVSMKSPMPIGLLELEILEAENLIAADTSLTGKQSSDPYVEFRVGLAKMRTSTISNTLNPKWSDGPDYHFVYNLSQVIRLEVYDDDTFTDDLIGLLPGYSVYWLCQEAENKPEGQWFDLQAPDTGDGKTKYKNAGRIKLRVRYLDLDDLDEGARLLQAPPKVEAPWQPTPFVMTVKLLGLEGDLAPGFVGSRCTVELLKPKTHTSESDGEDLEDTGPDTDGEGAAKEKPEALMKGKPSRKSVAEKKPSIFQRGLNAVKGVAKAVEHATDRVKAATGLGFGARELGIASKKRSTKARPWAGHLKEQKNSPAFAIPPMVVRAIEQLKRREQWEVQKIAEMFGVDVAAVEVAQGLRTNFAVVWSEGLHFLSKQAEPFAGAIKIDVHAAPGPVQQKDQSKRKSVAAVGSRSLVGEGGLIGSVRLDLKHETLKGDEPWRRRVRARLRRPKVDSNLMAMIQSTHESLHGEHQCDSSIGDIVPGVLIEFLVEIRATKPSSSHNHLEKEQVVLDKDELLASTRKRALQVILT